MKTMKGVLGVLVAVGLSLTGAGCAGPMALISSQAKKTVTVKGNLDEALVAVKAAGKDLGYSVSTSNVRNNPSQKVFTGLRGWGYFETSSLAGRFTDSNGVVSGEFEMKSNKGSQEMLDEYLAAFGKHVQAQ